MNDKGKVTKKKHLDELFELKAQIEALIKKSRVKDKTIHDLSKNLDNARDTIKNLKSEKSQQKMSKTKLTGEIRKLEKKFVDKKTVINMKTSSQHEKLKSVVNKSETSDENENVSTVIGSSSHPSILCIAGPIHSSMITHWNPLPLESSSFATMVTHTAQSPPPSYFLCSTQEFQEMIDKMCKRVFEKLGLGIYMNEEEMYEVFGSLAL